MRILVVGAGATGGFFGARLAQAGRDVTFLVRPKRAELLRERGLRIVGLGRAEVITPRLVTAAELAAGSAPLTGAEPAASPYDLILLSVKATALDQALTDVAPAVGPETVIVPFLNGIAHMATLNGRFGAHAVFGGVVKVVTTVNPDGDITQFTPLSTMTIGEQDGSRTPRLAEIFKALDGAGFDLDTSPDILAAMWHKWVFISTIGAMTSLARGTVGEITAVPGGTGLGPAMLTEAAAVAEACGYPAPAAEMAAITAVATQKGSDFGSSMSRDAMTGQPTEVEHILGDLTDRARAHGVQTPLLDLATLQLRVHERRLAARLDGAS